VFLIPESAAAAVGLQPPVTYGQAYQSLDRRGCCHAGRAFVAAALNLRTDERVQGRELELPISEGPAGIREKVVGSFTTKRANSVERPVADGRELRGERPTRVIRTESSSCK
jgi:hypothetical protein